MSTRTALRRHRMAWGIAFTVSVAVLLITWFASASASADDRYRAVAVVEVVPTTAEVSPQLLEFQIPSIEVRAVSAAFEREVRPWLPSSLIDATWTVATEVTLGSGVVSITVESDEELVPIPVANGYAARLAANDFNREGLDVAVISPASRTERVSTRPIIVVSGLSLALIIPLATLVWLAIRDQTAAARRSPELPEDAPEPDPPPDSDDTP